MSNVISLADYRTSKSSETNSSYDFEAARRKAIENQSRLATERLNQTRTLAERMKRTSKHDNKRLSNNKHTDDSKD